MSVSCQWMCTRFIFQDRLILERQQTFEKAEVQTDRYIKAAEAAEQPNSYRSEGIREK